MLAEALFDDFNDNSIDTAKWDASQNGDPSQIVEAGEMLKISHAATGQYVQFISRNTYDLTGSFVSVRVIDRGNQSLVSHDVILAVFPDTNNELWVTANNNSLSSYKKVAGVQTQIGTMAYDTVAMRYWRIRETDGTIYIDTSPDRADWTNRWNLTNPFAITSLLIQLQSGCWQTEASGSYGIFDDFNIPKANKFKNSGTRPRSFAPGIAR